MKPGVQVQLETALTGQLKRLCRQLLIIRSIQLGSVEMKDILVIAKYFWLAGSSYVINELTERE